MKRVFIIMFIIFTGCVSKNHSESNIVQNSPSEKFKIPIFEEIPNNTILNPINEGLMPIIAIWMKTPGHTTDMNYPYLRIGLWSDGRIVFCRDPNKWSHDLLIGKISNEIVNKTLTEIDNTKIFSVKDKEYWTVDSLDCVITVNVDNHKTILRWDEVTHPLHGHNLNPHQQYLAFKNIWFQINQILISKIPDKASKLNEKFKMPSKEWWDPVNKDTPLLQRNP